MDMLGGAQAKGVLAGWAWKGFEAFSQISWRNKLLVSFDWVSFSTTFGELTCAGLKMSVAFASAAGTREAVRT